MTFLLSTWLQATKRKAAMGARSRRIAKRARPHRIVPRLEVLEDRTVPSTLTVINNLDTGVAGGGSLRGEIAAAQSGDTINFDPSLAGQTITLTSGELAVNKSLDIEGLGADELTISGNNASRVFDISGSTTAVEVAGLTIADGLATGTTRVGIFGPVTLGGAILNTGAKLTLSNVTLVDNQALGAITEGGAVANLSGATLEVWHSTFTDNKSTGAIASKAGALANDLGSTLVLDHSTFAGNEVTSLRGAGLLPIQGNALGGALNNLSGSQATVSHCAFEGNSAHGGNGADGGPGQNGGNAGTGVGGAISNDGGSLLGPFAPSTMTVEDSLFLGNQAIGGKGGNGGAGGNGGNGTGLGVAAGAINNGSSTLTVSGSKFIGNEAIGGAGGHGGAGGNGGAGSAARAGAIASVPTPKFGSGLPPVRATVHVINSLFLDNDAIGGAGGSGGNGGAGGAGQGGALRMAFTDWDISQSLFVLNQATGGAGGDEGSGGPLGGNGGAGQGGALINVNGSIGTLADSTLVLNTATGGVGGLGGNGGNGQGGGAFNGAPAADGTLSSLTLLGTRIVNNEAAGGAAGVGGSDGQGVGGGVYNLGTFVFDILTVIKKNHASTSNNDIFP